MSFKITVEVDANTAKALLAIAIERAMKRGGGEPNAGAVVADILHAWMRARNENAAEEQPKEAFEPTSKVAPSGKFTATMVANIRAALKRGVSTATLAKAYSTSPRYIRKIRSGGVWK